MKLNKKYLLVNLIVILLLVAPLVSLGQGHVPAPCDQSGKICNPISTNNVNELVKKFLEGALKIGIPFIALAIIYSGFLFVAARGNPESLSKAKSTFMYTLIGAAILLGAWAIAKLISETVLSL